MAFSLHLLLIPMVEWIDGCWQVKVGGSMTCKHGAIQAAA